MNTTQFSQALGEIDSRYLEEALALPGKRRRRSRGRLAALAACAALVLLAALIPLRDRTQPKEPSHTGGGAGESDPAALTFNRRDSPSGGVNLFDLAAEDFLPMTYEELLAYFQVTLPVAEVCPQLSRVEESGGFGRFASDSRGTYYDGNTVAFADETGRQQVWIGLQKVWQCSGGIYGIEDAPLRFTTINGRELALFRYEDEEGNGCCYVEFVQRGTAFLLTMRNLSQEDMALLLQALVEESPGGQGLHTATGCVTVVDPYANYVVVDWEDGSCGVRLPPAYAAGDYALGDTVQVTYQGEPAAIHTILAQQLLEFTSVAP